MARQKNHETPLPMDQSTFKDKTTIQPPRRNTKTTGVTSNHRWSPVASLSICGLQADGADAKIEIQVVPWRWAKPQFAVGGNGTQNSKLWLAMSIYIYMCIYNSIICAPYRFVSLFLCTSGLFWVPFGVFFMPNCFEVEEWESQSWSDLAMKVCKGHDETPASLMTCHMLWTSLHSGHLDSSNHRAKTS